MSSGKSKALGVFALAMINVAAVLSLRNYPSMAIYGWSSIGWYLIGTIAFLIPLTLAGAELATGWPQGGGVYAWVREAFGEKAGFIAVFCEWSNNLVWFPTVLAFIASTFAYLFNPELANDNMFMFVVMMVAFWGTTIISLMGEQTSSRFGSFGVIAGSIVPAILIIVLGLAYWFSGQPISLPPFSWSATLPEINISTLPFIATVVLLFAGMEMAGFHALEVRNPQKDYPKAMAVSSSIIFLLTVIGTLAIAIVVPVDQLSLAAGLMQAFQSFLQAFNLSWLLVPLALLVTLGGLANLASWLAGPALGLGEVAARGNMPPFFARTNKNGAPTGVLILQAAIGTVVSMLYLFIPSISAAYWILSAMTVLLLCIVYLFVFAALIKLRYSQPDTPRAFKIPGGIPGIWVTGGVGFLACLITFVVSLIPPGSYEHVSTFTYAIVMLAGTAILALPPLVFLRLRKPSWNLQTKKEVQS
ncbi:MAG: amino acid permease [Methanotrichaceae archaeon]|nr:amino acid permease [Methanotrichaceae archaeon]